MTNETNAQTQRKSYDRIRRLFAYVDQTTSYMTEVPAKQNTNSARNNARTSARAIRLALMRPATAGERCVAHIDLSRPRRGVWLGTWPNLPGLTLDLGKRSYSHALLPGWEYTPREMRSEMIGDLEHFAETGEQPKVATR